MDMQSALGKLQAPAEEGGSAFGTKPNCQLANPVTWLCQGIGEQASGQARH